MVSTDFDEKRSSDPDETTNPEAANGNPEAANGAGKGGGASDLGDGTPDSVDARDRLYDDDIDDGTPLARLYDDDLAAAEAAVDIKSMLKPTAVESIAPGELTAPSVSIDPGAYTIHTRTDSCLSLASLVHRTTRSRYH
jgi:hypothetical protein